MEKQTVDPWLYIRKYFDTTINNTKIYDLLLEELADYFIQGIIKLGGKIHKERRLTCYFTILQNPNKNGGQMKYSGRILKPLSPPINSTIEYLFKLVSSEEFRVKMGKKYSRLKGIIPIFNAVFINYYRPPELTDDKPDYLGPHSDDESYLSSQVILSITYCSENGARMFRFYGPKPSSKVYAEVELEDGDMLFMLSGCQKKYKHSVSDNKYNSKKQPIVGGRINLTFRAVIE